MTLQVQRSELWFIDFNPSLRYRIRNIVSAGVGWNERIIFDNDFHFYSAMRVYGLRSFAEVSVLKGLWLRADVERMNAFVPVSPVQFDIGERKTVWCYLGGVKKEFTFSQGVIANVQFMYNLYDLQKTSPYFSRFNVRFGFDFPLKGKSERPLR